MTLASRVWKLIPRPEADLSGLTRGLARGLAWGLQPCVWPVANVPGKVVVCTLSAEQQGQMASSAASRGGGGWALKGVSVSTAFFEIRLLYIYIVTFTILKSDLFSAFGHTLP